MKIKPVVILFVILCLITLLLTLFSRQPRSEALRSFGNPILPRHLIAQIAQITLTEKNSEKTITLQKKDNDIWRIPNYYNAPANFTRIAKLIDDLEASKIQRAVTANPERLQRLGLNARTVAFYDAQSNEIYNISIGDFTPEGGLYVQLHKNDLCYEAYPPVFYTASPDEWLAREFFQFDIQNIHSLEFQISPDCTAKFQRDDQGKWQMIQPQLTEGQSLKNDMPESLLRQILDIKVFQHKLITDPYAQAALQKARLFELTLKDGQKFSFKIGRAQAAENTSDSSSTAEKPVLLFLQNAPENYVWLEAARTIIPYVSETLFKQIPSSIEEMLAPIAENETTDQHPSTPQTVD